jgi:hypothetical protein
MIEKNYLESALMKFEELKSLAEKAVAQINDEQLFHVVDPESNSIALVIKHMAGNLRSRWTNFLVTDGEKANRNRDSEFEIYKDDTRESLIAKWNEGWKCLFDSIRPLQPDDLMRTITIRGEIHTVVEAINRQLVHYSYHIGQIVFLAKFFASSKWKSLSIPKRSREER